ncbi:MAG: bifunctional folylpolyglutamate synthase/dihydrofolate synthase [Caulobacterales bacterium]|jgi:dihydrofolate synthase/folylpolyglutamate synthase
MNSFPPDDPVANRLNSVFGGEFDHSGPMSLERLREALATLGGPHLRLPPTIHVAGTNGKGSTVAFLQAIAASAGLRAHTFTQPHLIWTRERFTIAGQEATDDGLLSALDRIAAAAPTLSHFEAQTAAAFQIFADTPADLAILEVGCGGRVDATNVIPSPAVCVITPVDWDHVGLLGPTLRDIAAHKAGIIKCGANVVSARQAPEVEEVIANEADAKGAHLKLEGRDWQCWREGDRLVVQTSSALIDLPLPTLSGPHQVANAGLAVVAAVAFGMPEIAFAPGILRAFKPGRLQRLRKGPLAELAAETNCLLVADAGHNPHAGKALAAWLAQRPTAHNAAVVGMLADKEANGFLQPFARRLAGVVAVSAIGPRPAMPLSELVQHALSAGSKTAHAAPDLRAAIQDACELTGPGGTILITGSHAIAGEAIFAADSK